MPSGPIVTEVIAFEALPPAEPGSRRAVVRSSDGTCGEALRWYDDEILFCEGDLLGRSAAELRSLHFRRDRDFLADEPDADAQPRGVQGRAAMSPALGRTVPAPRERWWKLKPLGDQCSDLM